MSDTYKGLGFVTEETSIGDETEETSIGDLGAPVIVPADPAPVIVPAVADPVTEAFNAIPTYVARIDNLEREMGTLSKLVCDEAKRRRKLFRIIASLRCKLRNLERELRGDRLIKAPTPRYDPRFQDRDGLGLAYAIPSAADRKRKAAEKRDAARKSGR